MKPTVKEILAQLIALVAPMKGARIKDFGNDLHGRVQNLVTAYLATFDLQCSTWGVSPIFHKGTIIYEKIFNYTLPDFKDDKRARYGRIGNIVDIEFVVCDQFKSISTDLTLEGFLIEAEIILREEHVKQCVIGVREAKKNLAEAESFLMKANRELSKVKQKRKATA